MPYAPPPDGRLVFDPLEHRQRVFIKRKGRFAVLLGALFTTACTAPPPTSVPGGFDITNRTASTYDLMYIAVLEIEVRCPDFGATLFAMIQNNQLGWGDPSPFEYGHATYGTIEEPGTIIMDDTRYELEDLEMLIHELFHESGHALGDEADDEFSYVTSFGREGLNTNSWDSYSGGQSCPSM